MNTSICKTTKFGQPHMNTMDMKKVGLDAWYDKRRMMDGIHTEPFGLTTMTKRPLYIRLENNMRNRAEEHKIEYKLGCDIREFTRYIEKQFRIGMC